MVSAFFTVELRRRCGAALRPHSFAGAPGDPSSQVPIRVINGTYLRAGADPPPGGVMAAAGRALPWCASPGLTIASGARRLRFARALRYHAAHETPPALCPAVRPACPPVPESRP
jgi:hypothetical protein